MYVTDKNKVKYITSVILANPESPRAEIFELDKL